MAVTAMLGMAGECHAQSSALPPTATGTFSTYSADANVATQNQLSASSMVVQRDPGYNRIIYDAASGTYMFRDPTSTNPLFTTFASGNGFQTVTTTAVTTDYNLPSVGLSYTAFSIANGTSGLSYTAYGIYTSHYHSPSFDSLSVEPFVFGQPTPASAMPISGLAYYRGAVDGYILYGITGVVSPTRLVNSTGDLLVNFATGQVATGLNLSTASGFFGRLDGRGSITSGTSQFSGSLFGSGTNYAGFFNGGLFGPGAQEAGFTFAATDSASVRTVTGAFTGATASVPTPPPATVTPIVAGANANLTGTLASQTFNAFSSRATFNSSSAIATELGNLGDVSITYNASTGTYALSSGVGSPTFSAAAMTSDGTTRSVTVTRPMIQYGFLPVTPTDQINLFVNSNSNSRVSLTYMSYGVWTSTMLGTTYTTFLYGAQTPTAQLPRSGLALYDGVVGGVWTQGNYTYRLDGYSLGSILANFTTGEVRTTMAIAGYDPVYKVNATLGRIDGYGSITAATGVFNGNLGGQGYTGTFQGGFFGPAAQEAGATFALNGPTAKETLSGVIAARQVPLPH